MPEGEVGLASRAHVHVHMTARPTPAREHMPHASLASRATRRRTCILACSPLTNHPTQHNKPTGQPTKQIQYLMAGPAAATTAKAASSSSAPRAPSPFIPTGRRPTLKQMALMAWEVVKVFSAPINNPVLRLCSLWAMIIYVIFTFAVSLVVRVWG